MQRRGLLLLVISPAFLAGRSFSPLERRLGSSASGGCGI